MNKIGSPLPVFPNPLLALKQAYLVAVVVSNSLRIDSAALTFVCIDFGQVERYDMVDEYIDSVYENRNEMKRKSKYRREYHVNNSIDTITCKNNTGIQLTYEIRMKIRRDISLDE